MGLLGGLFGKRSPPPVAFEAAAELAGFYMAHALWCVSDGETLIPLIGHEGPGERGLVRFAADRLEDGARQAQEWMTRNPLEVKRAFVAVDGFFTQGGQKKDAIVGRAVEFGPPRQSLQIILPYTPKSDGVPSFAVHRPKFGEFEGLAGVTQAIGEAFFRGVDRHEKGSAVWNANLDESF